MLITESLCPPLTEHGAMKCGEFLLMKTRLARAESLTFERKQTIFRELYSLLKHQLNSMMIPCFERPGFQIDKLRDTLSHTTLFTVGISVIIMNLQASYKQSNSSQSLETCVTEKLLYGNSGMLYSPGFGNYPATVDISVRVCI
jgi:hypothetical protein